MSVQGDTSQLKSELKTIELLMGSLGQNINPDSFNTWIDKLQQIKRETKEMDKAFDKFGDVNVMPNKDLAKFNESSRNALKNMNDLRKAIEGISKSGKLDGLEVDKEVIGSYHNLVKSAKNYADITKNLNSNVRLKPDQSVKQMQKDLKDLGQESERVLAIRKEIADTNIERKNIKTASRKAKTISDQGLTTGKITYNDDRRLKDLTSDGVLRDYRKASEQAKRRREENAKKILDNNEQIKELSSIKVKDRTPKQQEKLADLTTQNDELAKLNNLLGDFSEDVKRATDSLQSSKNSIGRYDVKSERGSWKATLEDRAPSIGMAGVGAVGFALGSKYQRGQTLNKQDRDTMFFRGNLSGDTDYTNLRRETYKKALETGYGYDIQNVNQMTDSYIAMNGYNGKQDMYNGSEQFQRAGRALNIDNDAFQQAYSTIGHTGALKGKDGVGIEQFTNTFVGALDNSKMTAKSEEQLKALESVATTLGQTRALSTRDMEEQATLQGQLASTGNRMLQGEQGANALNKISNGLQNGKDDPFLLQQFGYGSEYTGIKGKNQAIRQMEKGATAENISRVIDNNPDQETARLQLSEVFGLSQEEIDGIMKAYDDGKLTDSEMKKAMKKNKKDGKKKADEDSENVKNSRENESNQSELSGQKSDSDTASSFDWVEKMKGAVNRLPLAANLLIVAAGALLASATTSMAMAGGAQMTRKLVGRAGRSRFGQTRIGKKLTKGGSSGGGGFPTGTGAPGGTPPKTPNGGGNSSGGGIPTGKGGTNSKGNTTPKGTQSKGRFSTIGNLGKRFIGMDTQPKDSSPGGQMKGFTRNIKRGTIKGRRFVRDTDWKGLITNTDNTLRRVGETTGKNTKEIFNSSMFNPKKYKGVTTKGKGLLSKLSKGNKGTNGIMSQAPGNLGGLSKISGVSRNLLKHAGLLGAGLTAVDLGSSIASGDKDRASQSIGDLAGGAIDPFGLGYGKIVSDPIKDMAKKAGNTDKVFGKNGLFDFSWNTPKKESEKGLIQKWWEKSFNKPKNTKGKDKSSTNIISNSKLDRDKVKSSKFTEIDKGKNLNPAGTVPILGGLVGAGISDNDSEQKQGNNDSYKLFALLVA